MTKTVKSVVTTRASSVRIKSKNTENTNNKTVLGFMTNIGTEDKIERKAIENKLFSKKASTSENIDANYREQKLEKNGAKKKNEEV